MAEEYFNFCARRQGIQWLAESKALIKDLSKTSNVGPISPHARQLLADKGIPIQKERRMPSTLTPGKVDHYQIIVSMSQNEHEPMIDAFWPGIFPMMDYWEVGDIGVDSPQVAFAKIRKGVDGLIEQLG